MVILILELSDQTSNTPNTTTTFSFFLDPAAVVQVARLRLDTNGYRAILRLQATLQALWKPVAEIRCGRPVHVTGGRGTEVAC